MQRPDVGLRRRSGVFMVPPIGAGVWIEFEHGDPDNPIWTGGWWGSAADVPTLALAGDPAGPNIVISDDAAEHGACVSDPADTTTGGIMLKSTTGAMIVVNDTGIYINERQGRDRSRSSGPTVTINNGALVVIDEENRCRASCFTSARRCSAHTRAGAPDGAQSARAGQWPADRDDHGAIRRRRLRDAAAARRQRPLRDRAVDQGADARHVNGQPLVLLRQPGDLRADRHAGAHRRRPDARHRDVRRA